jgi:nitric oxide reductase NorQ protein
MDKKPESYIVGEDVFYIPQGRELDIALACYELKLPLMLRGPTGCGKTTLVQYLSRTLQKPLITEACNEDTLAADLIGRRLHTGWSDGSATFSLRFTDGAIFYLDELGEARQDALVVVHPLTDDRRTLEIRGSNEVLTGNDQWMVAASYNPAYQLQNKVKPSTLQRFVTLDIPFPSAELEERIVDYKLHPEKVEKSGTKVSRSKYQQTSDIPVKSLVKLAGDYRRMAATGDVMGLREGPGTRLVARTGLLIGYGLPVLESIEAAMINPLTHDQDQKKAMIDIAKKLFR